MGGKQTKTSRNTTLLLMAFFLSPLHTSGAQENGGNESEEQSRVRRTDSRNNWRNMMDQALMATLPIEGETLTGIMMRKKYSLEELKNTPFSLFLIENNFLSPEELRAIFNEKKDENNKMQGIYFFKGLPSMRPLAIFNEREKARVFSRNFSETFIDSFLNEEKKLMQEKKDFLDAQNDSYDRALGLMNRGEKFGGKAIVSIFSLVFFATFCYGFFLPLLQYMAPTKKPQTIASTSIVLWHERLANFLLFPKLILHFCTFGFISSPYAPNGEGSKEKGHYREANRKDLVRYKADVEVWLSNKKSSLPHLLLEGRPGLGKTLFAKNVIKSQKGKIDFIITDSKRLQMLVKNKDSGEILKEFHRFYEMARRSQKKVIIFIDEAEKMGDHIEVLLGLFAKASDQKVVLILAVNDPKKLPNPILSRMGKRIKILSPSKEEIKSIIEDALLDIEARYGVRIGRLDGAQREELFAFLERRKLTGRDLKEGCEKLGRKAFSHKNKRRKLNVGLGDLIEELGLEKIRNLEERRKKEKEERARLAKREEELKRLGQEENKNTKKIKL